MSGAAQQGIQGIPEGALEPIPTQLAVAFHMADRGFNGTASVDGFPDGRGDAALLSATPDRHAFDADAAIALFDERIAFIRRRGRSEWEKGIISADKPCWTEPAGAEAMEIVRGAPEKSIVWHRNRGVMSRG